MYGADRWVAKNQRYEEPKTGGRPLLYRLSLSSHLPANLPSHPISIAHQPPPKVSKLIFIIILLSVTGRLGKDFIYHGVVWIWQNFCLAEAVAASPQHKGVERMALRVCITTKGSMPHGHPEHSSPHLRCGVAEYWSSSKHGCNGACCLL